MIKVSLKMKHYSITELSEALFTVNKHAKTAPSPKFLYTLKRVSIDKLLQEGKAEKKGLQFSANASHSQQVSTVLIACGDYLFHTTATKSDFASLSHLGHLSDTYRNPQTRMGLNMAKKILSDYTGCKEVEVKSSGPKFNGAQFTRLGDSMPTIPATKYRKE